MALGNVSVGLNLKNKAFNKGMRKSGQVSKGFGKTLASTKGKMVAFGGAMVGAVATGAFASMIKGQLGVIDATAKLADRTNISVEALTGLRHAAQLSGESAATLDGGLQKMTRGIGQAIQGTGAARTALESMGISIESIKNLRADEQFALISDGINGFGTQAEKAAAAADIFGRAGINMLNTMALGSEGLQTARKEAELLGVAFDRTDAAQVEAANDALLRVSQLVTGIGQKLAIELAPYIEFVSTKMVEFATTSGGVGQFVIKAVEKVAKGIAFAADIVRVFELAWIGAKVVIAGVITGMLWQFQMIEKGILAVINLIPGVEIQASQTLGIAVEAMKETTKEFASDFKKTFEKDLPSTKVDKMFAKIKKGSKLAAAEIAKARETAVTPIAPPEDPDKTKSTGKFQGALAGTGINAIMTLVSGASAEPKETMAEKKTIEALFGIKTVLETIKELSKPKVGALA